MELTKELVCMINLCGGDAEYMESISQGIVGQLNGLQLAAARAAYVTGYNDAVAKDAKQCLNSEDFNAMIAETSGIEAEKSPSASIGDPSDEKEQPVKKTCNDCVDNDICEARGKPLICVSFNERGDASDFDLADAKKEVLDLNTEKSQQPKTVDPGVEIDHVPCYLLDYRHAEREPGLTMCRAAISTQFEITEGNRVNCPYCLAAIEVEQNQP